MVIYSEMRKLCLGYVMQSKCGRKRHSIGPERWMHKNSNRCQALWADVTLPCSLGFQTQILKLSLAQEAPSACILLTCSFTGFLLLVTILHYLGWKRNGISVVHVEKEPSFTWKNLRRRKQVPPSPATPLLVSLYLQLPPPDLCFDFFGSAVGGLFCEICIFDRAWHHRGWHQRGNCGARTALPRVQNVSF